MQRHRCTQSLIQTSAPFPSVLPQSRKHKCNYITPSFLRPLFPSFEGLPLHLMHQRPLHGIHAVCLRHLRYGVRHLLVGITGLDQFRGSFRSSQRSEEDIRRRARDGRFSRRSRACKGRDEGGKGCVRQEFD